MESQGCVDVELEAVRQTVVELVIESVLAEIGILGGLKAVEFVERLEVERAVAGDVGVIGIEGHLSPQKACAANRAQRQKNDSAEVAHVEVILTVNGALCQRRVNSAGRLLLRDCGKFAMAGCAERERSGTNSGAGAGSGGGAMVRGGSGLCKNGAGRPYPD